MSWYCVYCQEQYVTKTKILKHTNINKIVDLKWNKGGLVMFSQGHRVSIWTRPGPKNRGFDKNYTWGAVAWQEDLTGVGRADFRLWQIYSWRTFLDAWITLWAGAKRVNKARWGEEKWNIKFLYSTVSNPQSSKCFKLYSLAGLPGSSIKHQLMASLGSIRHDTNIHHCL